MSTPAPSYEPGDLVVVSELMGFPQYNRSRACVMTVKGTYDGTNASGIRVYLKGTYKVMFMDGTVGILTPDKLSPAEPANRMDHDQQVAWADMPEDIQRIWKESAQ